MIIKLEKSERAEASNGSIRTQTAKAAQSLTEAIQAALAATVHARSKAQSRGIRGVRTQNIQDPINRRLYLDQSKIIHPDKNTGCEDYASDKFQCLNFLWETSVGNNNGIVRNNYNDTQKKVSECLFLSNINSTRGACR